MERIATPDVDPDLHGTGKDGFKDGVPPGEAPTSLSADWFNAAQEEIAQAIEREGYALEVGNFNQLYLAQRNQRLGDVIFRPHTFRSTWTTTRGVAAASFPPVKSAFHLTPMRAVVAFCRNNLFQVSIDYGVTFVSWGALTAVLNACACRAGNTEQGDSMAVGDAGEWFYFSVANGNDSGPIGGTPDLDYVFWDETNALWWALGPGGIYKSPDVNISWTQITAIAHQGGAVIPSTGRVVFFRPGDSIIYYTDDNSTLVAGADLSGISTVLANMEYDDDAGEVFIAHASGIQSVTDGTTAGVNATVFSTEQRLFTMGGRVGGTALENIIMRTTLALTATATDWRSGQVTQLGEGVGAVGGCPEFLVWMTTTGDFYISPVIPDLNGA